MCRRLLAVAAVVSLFLPASPVFGALFFEPFDGPGLPTTLNYTTSSNVTWSINGSQQLFGDYTGIYPPAANGTAITQQGFAPIGNMPLVYSLDVGVPTGIPVGSYNVGMIFGGYQMWFHPGYGGGAFNLAGGYSQGSLNMGFTLQTGILHHVEVTVWPQVGGSLPVDVRISGLGTDSQPHTFLYSFLDTTPNLGTGTFGGRYSGGSGQNAVSDVWFDNFRADVVPEPSTSALLGLGGVGLVAYLGRRRRRQRADVPRWRGVARTGDPDLDISGDSPCALGRASPLSA